MLWMLVMYSGPVIRCVKVSADKAKLAEEGGDHYKMLAGQHPPATDSVAMYLVPETFFLENKIASNGTSGDLTLMGRGERVQNNILKLTLSPSWG